MSSTQQLHQIIDSMERTRILVIGDVMLDVYEHCVVRRISPEAPVPIATVIETFSFLGGAANVANNARALGAQVSLVSVVGDDSGARMICEQLEMNDIDCTGLITDPERVTTVKKRIVAGTQHLMRIDTEVTQDINTKTSSLIFETLKEQISAHDIIIISDYCKGLLTEQIIHFIKEEARRDNKKIFVDSKDKSLRKYSDVYLIKPNKEEAEHLAGEKFAPVYSNLEAIGRGLSEIFKSHVVITLGADGIALFADDTFVHKTTKNQQVFDVSGAGDTVLATIATAIGAGATLDEAVDLSNHAAGHVVSLLGTTVCTHERLRQIIDGN